MQPVEHYDLTAPADTRAYGPGVLHSTEHPSKAWVIRVTGTDVDAIPRYPLRARDATGWSRRFEMALKFRVELVWQDEKETASSIYLTSDGRVILQGRTVARARARGDVAAADGRDDQRRPQPDPRHQGDAVAGVHSGALARASEPGIELQIQNLPSRFRVRAFAAPQEGWTARGWI